MKPFFTLPDPDITQESSLDPMGMQVIWTHYGQAIFQDKLTTVANNLRAFTFNLFHAHLINRLFQEHPEELALAKEQFTKWETELDIKTGLLIFLEDLVTWIFYDAQQSSTNRDLHGLGTLGLNKARLADNSRKPIVLTANKNAGLLKYQLNLGMTGRYKGPMTQMGFFNRNFEIKYAQNPQWDKVEKLIRNWKEGSNLQTHLLKLITENLFQSNRKDWPQIIKGEIETHDIWDSVSKGYIDAFGSRKQTKEIRAFWKDKLGLMSGAASALYEEISKLAPGEPIIRFHIFKEAAKNETIESDELEKLKSVIAVEPFLSHTEYLLRYLAQNNTKNLSDHLTEIEQLRSEIERASKFDLKKAPEQLQKLHSYATTKGSTQEWVKQIITYHKVIMQQRGGNVWCEMNDEGQFKHYFSPRFSESLNTIPKYLNERPWLHSYYLETLQSIHTGLN